MTAAHNVKNPSKLIANSLAAISAAAAMGAAGHALAGETSLDTLPSATQSAPPVTPPSQNLMDRVLATEESSSAPMGWAVEPTVLTKECAPNSPAYVISAARLVATYSGSSQIPEAVIMCGPGEYDLAKIKAILGVSPEQMGLPYLRIIGTRQNADGHPLSQKESQRLINQQFRHTPAVIINYDGTVMSTGGVQLPTQTPENIIQLQNLFAQGNGGLTLAAGEARDAAASQQAQLTLVSNNITSTTQQTTTTDSASGAQTDTAAANQAPQQTTTEQAPAVKHHVQVFASVGHFFSHLAPHHSRATSETALASNNTTATAPVAEQSAAPAQHVQRAHLAIHFPNIFGHHQRTTTQLAQTDQAPAAKPADSAAPATTEQAAPIVGNNPVLAAQTNDGAFDRSFAAPAAQQAPAADRSLIQAQADGHVAKPKSGIRVIADGIGHTFSRVFHPHRQAIAHTDFAANAQAAGVTQAQVDQPSIVTSSSIISRQTDGQVSPAPATDNMSVLQRQVAGAKPKQPNAVSRTLGQVFAAIERPFARRRPSGYVATDIGRNQQAQAAPTPAPASAPIAEVPPATQSIQPVPVQHDTITASSLPPLQTAAPVSVNASAHLRVVRSQPIVSLADIQQDWRLARVAVVHRDEDSATQNIRNALAKLRNDIRGAYLSRTLLSDDDKLTVARAARYALLKFDNRDLFSLDESRRFAAERVEMLRVIKAMVATASTTAQSSPLGAQLTRFITRQPKAIQEATQQPQRPLHLSMAFTIKLAA